MDGELLWNTIYRVVLHVARGWPAPPARRGSPDDYLAWEIALLWLWTAFWDQPLITTTKQLTDKRIRQGLKMLGFRLPRRVPHETTIRRRSRRADYTAFIEAVNHALVAALRGRCDRLLIDSTLMPVPHVSKDRDATWGHHGQRGYRWHTLTSRDRVILQEQVEGANVHELTVAPVLIDRAAHAAIRPRFVVGDHGYDSEPLHRCVRERLHARLIAPLNDRGGKRTMQRTPHRRWLNQHWNDRPVASAYRDRPEIDRMYSEFKGHRVSLYALPPWVRHLPAVRRWVELKQVIYHANLTLRRRKRAA
jgi:DDE family transposase